MIFRDAQLRTPKLNSRPAYYQSMANNPSAGRLDRSMDVDSNVFTIEKILRFSFNVVYGSDVQTHTVKHGLGYRPEVLGNYYFKSIKNFRLIGDYPGRQFPGDGSLWIDSVTENDLTIGCVIPDFMGPSSPDNDDIVMKLFILKNEAI